MNRFRSLTAASLVLAAACAAPTDPTPGVPLGAATPVGARSVIHYAKPSLTTTACVNTSDQMVVTIDWANQIIDQNQILTVDLVFRGQQLPTTSTEQQGIGPFDPTSFVSFTLDKFQVNTQPVSWDDWSSIGASTSGAFTDSAPRLQQPKDKSKGAWPTC